MAAEKTPDRINREQVGSLTMTIADYYAGSTNLDNGDYWTSGIQGIVGYWGCNSDNPTTTGTGEGIDIDRISFSPRLNVSFPVEASVRVISIPSPVPVVVGLSELQPQYPTIP